MRRLLAIVLLAAFGWSAYWWIGATAQERALRAWLEDRQRDGWVAEVETLDVQGYPNRFDTIVEGIALADPLTGWSWTAPEFQILALSYRPTNVIAVWPQFQVFAHPDQRFEVRSERIRGSVRLAPSLALGLREARIELGDLSVESSLGWGAKLADGQFAIRRSPEDAAPENAYDVSLTADALTLPAPVKAKLDPANLLPEAIEGARIRLTPVYDRPLDRYAIEDTPPALMTLNVGNASFTWGRMALTVTGRLDADAAGYAEGSLNIIAQNWQDMLEIGVRGGWIPAGLQNSLASALALLAAGTGESGKLDLTLTFRGGKMRLGPLPIGDAPRMH